MECPEAEPRAQFLSLPLPVVESIVGYVAYRDKPVLLRTCRLLRQAVLQLQPCLTVQLEQLGSDRSYREVRTVTRRHQTIDKLTLNLKNSTLLQIQRLLSELSAARAEAEHPCVVSALVVKDSFSCMSGWGGQIGPAFPSITALELSNAFQIQVVDASTLQGLAQCPRLEALSVSAYHLHPSVTPQKLQSWLPAVTRLRTAVTAELWISALAPQLASLRFDGAMSDYSDWCVDKDVMDAETLLALQACIQLKEIELIVVSQHTLEALLALPNLATVLSTCWEADARWRSCNWSLLSCNTMRDARVADTLPRGIRTLRLGYLALRTGSTPAASLEAAQDYADAIARACQKLTWSLRPGTPISFYLDATCKQPGQVAACIAAMLQGLAPINQSFPPMHIHLQTPLPALDGAVVNALSAARGFLQQLSVHCQTVSPDAWATLPGTLPALRTLYLTVFALSGQSVDALRDLCIAPATPGSALLNISVRMPGGGEHGGEKVHKSLRIKQQLTQLQAQVSASGRAVQLQFSGY